jgi:hypothetical protein
MRKLLALAVAVPFLATAQEGGPAPVAAPPPPAQAYPQAYPPPPAYPPNQAGYVQSGAPEQQRDTWYIGFGLGSGTGSATYAGERLSFRETHGDAGGPTNGTFNFKVGATLTPNLLLGADITAIGSVLDEGGYETTLAISNVDAVVTWFPTGRGLFVRGGVGLSSYSFDVEGGFDEGYSEDATGVNVLGGVGYAFWLGRAFNLTLNLDVSAQDYGDDDYPESSRFANFYVGFDWY